MLSASIRAHNCCLFCHTTRAAQKECLEEEFLSRKNTRLRAYEEEQELRERLEQLQADYAAQKNERYDIISDFTRQNKNMQDELIVRINDLESTICNLKDQLELSKIALDEIRNEKDQQIKQKEREIAEQAEKMEDMSQEFHSMLKETLEKMNERIDEKHKDDAEVRAEADTLPDATDAPAAPAATVPTESPPPSDTVSGEPPAAALASPESEASPVASATE